MRRELRGVRLHAGRLASLVFPLDVSVFMMNRFGIFLLLLGVASGCANNRVEQIERESRSGIEDLRSIQAEHTQQLSRIQDTLRTLSGKVDELEHVALGKTAELEQSLKQVSSRVPPPSGVPEDLLDRDDQEIARISGPAADQYRLALGQLRSGNFDAARGNFESFYQANPQTAFSDNALFWTGVCYEKMGQCDRAILPLSDVFQKLPAEDFVPVALLRLADCFDKLGSSRDAVLTLQKLVDEHPRSGPAEEARGRLARRGPESRPGKVRSRR